MEEDEVSWPPPHPREFWRSAADLDRLGENLDRSDRCDRSDRSDRSDRERVVDLLPSLLPPIRGRSPPNRERQLEIVGDLRDGLRAVPLPQAASKLRAASRAW